MGEGGAGQSTEKEFKNVLEVSATDRLKKEI
jgi:hypothetical protein